ncbi:MAG TPA: helix-turn-helix transcriptional regulator [Flavipsychrobacter sp.]|nr:helix-turn-helix transcriptional regulator [Flavipsychrobacter sp.]
MRSELQQLGFHPLSVELGEIELAEELTEANQDVIRETISKLGFELIDDKRRRIIEKIKNTVITMVHHTEEESNLKHSEVIAQALHHDYAYLSKLFSEVEGITIEQFHIRQKVEKVKELLVYDELNLSEIAYRLGYSSVAHLSSQFKKITGLPPSHFKNIGDKQRTSIDKVGERTKVL